MSLPSGASCRKASISCPSPSLFRTWPRRSGKAWIGDDEGTAPSGHTGFLPVRRRHEFGPHRIGDLFGENGVDLRHARFIQLPAADIFNRSELIRAARAPQSDIYPPVQNPAHRQLQDGSAIAFGHLVE